MVMNMVAEALAHDRAIMPPCAGLSHQTVFEGAAECAICVLSRAPRSMQDKLIQAAEFRRDWARRNKKDDLYRQWREQRALRTMQQSIHSQAVFAAGRYKGLSLWLWTGHVETRRTTR